MEQKINKDQVKREALQTYFLDKSSTCKERKDGEPTVVPCFRTTQELIDELSPMVSIREEDVLEFMANHDYHMTTDEGGSVKWEIYKILPPQE